LTVLVTTGEFGYRLLVDCSHCLNLVVIAVRYHTRYTQFTVTVTHVPRARLREAFTVHALVATFYAVTLPAVTFTVVHLHTVHTVEPLRGSR